MTRSNLRHLRPDQARAYDARYRERHAERVRAAQEQFHATHPEARSAYDARYNTQQGPARWFLVRLRRSHLTLAQYEAMEAAQGGLCAICGKPETAVLRGRVTRLTIDHDHKCCPSRSSCGRCIRGLICRRCNTAIGLLSDDVDMVLRAAAYLARAAERAA